MPSLQYKQLEKDRTVQEKQSPRDMEKSCLCCFIGTRNKVGTCLGMWYAFRMTFMDDLTPEEAKALLKEVRETTGAYGLRDKRICICGHSAGAHAEFSRDETRRREAEVGYASCKPSRQKCPCNKFVAVLVAENARKFMRKTTGGGKLHALGLGLAETFASGLEVEWLDAGKVCWKCGTGENIRPVALEANGVQVDRPSAYNAMLCPSCIGGIA